MYVRGDGRERKGEERGEKEVGVYIFLAAEGRRRDRGKWICLCANFLIANLIST